MPEMGAKKKVLSGCYTQPAHPRGSYRKHRCRAHSSKILDKCFFFSVVFVSESFLSGSVLVFVVVVVISQWLSQLRVCVGGY